MLSKSGAVMFNVVVVAEQHGYTVQALEYDLASQGDTVDKAMKAFDEAVVGQLLLDIKMAVEPFTGLDRAPKKFWDMRDQGLTLDRVEPIFSPMPEYKLNRNLFAMA